MSSGHTGAGTPDEGDDPFAYLYRPADGEAPRQQGPRQPSYNQVRPVGERTYGGQQTYGGAQGHRQPGAASPDARYAAPETQGMPGAGGGGHRQGPPDRRRPPAGDARRNGLLIGAVAVVVAVVLGVTAAIVFSSGGDDDTAADDPTPTQDTGGGDDQGGDDPSEEPTDEETADEAELPVAAVADLQPGGGAAVESTVTGARSDGGDYVAVRNAQGSTVTWTFDIEGEPLEQYYFYIGYSVVADGQTMAFSVNGEPREDPIDFKDWNPNSDDWETSWVKTYNNVNLVEGENTIQLTCSGSCDVLIDQMRLTEEREG
ncbi:carbohydrate-binding protein [Streptomyces sp. NPDC049879]|uniref:carbohydrate-binding protein n=1 Tax=Streptomyces sp. NPDC049879 TaxID=3365598 RepID=UPI00379CA0A5